MKKSARQLLKSLLPFGLVKRMEDRRRLQELGREVPLPQFWQAQGLVRLAETTGLGLLPAGTWKNLRCVVDVGASVGQWSIAVLKLVAPAKLIAIEPGPAMFTALSDKLIGRSGVELHNVAIGDKNCATTLRITRDTTGASVLPPRADLKQSIAAHWKVEAEVEVPMRTLDSLLADVEEISLLKIDVQGYEMEALAGAVETLSKTRFLLIELHYMPQYEGGSWFSEIHELLTRGYGFVLVDATKPLRLNGRASMSDGLYVNERLGSL